MRRVCPVRANMPEEEFDRVLAINLRGTFLTMKYEAQAMLRAGHGGAIVNVGSVNAMVRDGVPWDPTIHSSEAQLAHSS